MKHGVKAALLAGALTIVLAGCGQKTLGSGGAPTPQPAVSTPAAAAAATPTATPEPMKTKTVKVYFADDDLTKLIEKTATVSYKEDSEVYKAALEALKSTDQAGLHSLFAKVTFNSVKRDGGALRIDLTLNEGAQLGSGGESFFLDALKKTVFQFPEITELYVTKDGAQVESLMGHMDLPYPMKKS